MIAVFFQRIMERDTFPLAFCQVDFIFLICDDCRTANSIRDGRKQIFRQVHQIPKSRISPVKLTHGKFRIMLGIRTFIPKRTVDFKHFFQTAYDKAFQIQFRRNAQIQFHIESVVMRHKRTGVRPPCERVHHGRFHFHKIPVLHKIPKFTDNAGTLAENVTGFGIYD